jgi:Tc5 transposase DNA-binding domain
VDKEVLEYHSHGRRLDFFLNLHSKMIIAVDAKKRDAKKTSTHHKFKVKHLDEPMAEWVKKERAIGRAVSRSTIVRTATSLNAQLNGPASFSASQGWLTRFLDR